MIIMVYIYIYNMGGGGFYNLEHESPLSEL